MHKTICYHTRLSGNHSVKCVGGTFTGQIDMDTVNRLVKMQFEVRIKPSGSATFVDKYGREVGAYISIDPLETEIGKAAMAQHRLGKEAAQKLLNDQQAEIDELVSSMSSEELLKRLRS